MKPLASQTAPGSQAELDLHLGSVSGKSRREPLPSPSDWSFELIEIYHQEIAAQAKRFGLDTYPVQLEVISAGQMIDAYASVGMPVNYRHWSFGKQYIVTEKNYRRGHMGLA